jgi:hypothetical protein
LEDKANDRPARKTNKKRIKNKKSKALEHNLSMI